MSFDKAMSILIVDDYKTMLRIIRNLLKQLGFDEMLDEAFRRRDRVAAAARGRTSVWWISDWNMEPMTGAPAVEGGPVGPLSSLPHPVRHGHGREQDREPSSPLKEAGVTNYIVKPFNAETLKQKLTAVFGPF